MEAVIFKGWKEGLNKVALTQLIKKHAGYSLIQAKLSVDAIVEGLKVPVNVPSIEKAKKLKAEACKIGAICEVKKSLAHA